MIHRLTLGHLDAAAITRDGGAVVLKPLDMSAVHRLLVELGQLDAQGEWTLDDGVVEFHDGYVVVPWQGGWRNLVAEELALRLQQETGCLIADREHGRVVEPAQLQGLNDSPVAAQGTPRGKPFAPRRAP
jgi:hypothetical protein